MRVAAIGRDLDLSPEERLQFVIDNYADVGYIIVYRDSRSAQLKRPKRFSFVFAFLWLLVFGYGLLVYLIYYLAKRDEIVYLTLDDAGQVVVSD
mgnify:CR=1 FL=1